MNHREVSIAFQTNKNPDEYIELAKLADNFNFDAISVYCDAPYHPCYGPLILMAPHIQRARLGPAAVSPFRMHPIDIAANAALLSGIAKGGTYIGLSRGAWLNDFGIDEPQKPIRGIKEAVWIIRKMLSGDLAGLQGEVFQIADHVRAPYPLPLDMPPVMIGTWGPKLAALGGEIANEVKVGGSTNPSFAKALLPHIRRGEELANRKCGIVNLVMGAVTVIDSDRRIARRAAKSELARYLPIVANLDPTLSIDLDLVMRIRNLVELGELGSASNLISDDLMEKFSFAGDERDLINQAERLFEAGVSRIEFGTPHGLNPAVGIKMIGERVLPNLKLG